MVESGGWSMGVKMEMEVAYISMGIETSGTGGRTISEINFNSSKKMWVKVVSWKEQMFVWKVSLNHIYTVSWKFDTQKYNWSQGKDVCDRVVECRSYYVPINLFFECTVATKVWESCLKWYWGITMVRQRHPNKFNFFDLWGWWIVRRVLNVSVICYNLSVMDDNKLNHFHSKCKGRGAGT